MESEIRVWLLPTENEVDMYGDTIDGRNYCIGKWTENEKEPIWDLSHHQTQGLLLSACASDMVTLWKTDQLNEIETFDEKLNFEGQVVNRFVLGQGSDLYSPTTVSWINSS